MNIENYQKWGSRFVALQKSWLNIKNFFLVACIIHVFFLYSDYICNSLYVTRIFEEPQICYLICDIFQYSLAYKLNYIRVFILNFFIIFVELTIK